MPPAVGGGALSDATIRLSVSRAHLAQHSCLCSAKAS